MEQSAILSIGGLTVHYIGSAGVARALALPGMSLFRTETSGTQAMEIRLDSNVTLPECRWLSRFDLADGLAECRFGIDAEGVYHYDLGGYSHVRFDPRRPERVDISPLEEPTLLRFALWVAYSMAGLWHGAVPVHSSVAVCQGRAVLCLGESGTGKSTHTRLWINHIPDTYLLNDDSPILRVEEGQSIVYGSPWSGKTPCFRTESVPVAALVRLEQRPANSIRRLRTLEAFTALQPSCPPSLTKDEPLMDRLVDFVGSVIGNTPVFRLGCLPDADAAHLCHNNVFSS